MPSKTNNKNSTRAQILDKAIVALQTQMGYADVQHLLVGNEPVAVAKEQGRSAVLVFVPEHLGAVTPPDQELAIQLGAIAEGGPADYVWATSSGAVGEGFMYCWLPDQECQVSRIPNSSELTTTKSDRGGIRQIAADPVRFKQLQHEFDQLHEKVYAAREPIDGSNDLTAQLCKLIFLKMHVERHPDFRATPGDPLFAEVFTAPYIRKLKGKAVEQVKRAFSVAKERTEYNAYDDYGHDFRIFDRDDFIKFNQPATYAAVADMLNHHRLIDPESTGVEDDILGRAFDVMLRGKFEGKGGMGVYLTPQQVRDAMVQIAFADIVKEDPGLLTRRDNRTNKPEFRVCDPCCGSAGFLVTAMRELRKFVTTHVVGLSLRQLNQLVGEIYAEGFMGADNSPGMVLLARINMALHGDPRARVFRVENSLTSEIFTPQAYDLILTNPPFKKGGITTADNPELMRHYCSDIQGGRPTMAGDKLALGAKPDNKGVWKPVRSVDPAVLFIDRCLQLLKPGGRLLIVLPDGVLCNSGDRYVREYLMGRKDEETGRFVGGKVIVKAVVSLPPVTFRLSGAGAKTSFVYLMKKRPGDEQDAVFMAVADDVGFDVKQNKEVLTEKNDLVAIVEAFKAGKPRGESGE